ncbi:hypothetical protein QBC43DRAFT_40087 [Cladorrhinum sp. PSN259]|nr:hypothetical protein QBC43DRAFT_40087 [Cladorrhinum sp. PSN259]
MSSSSPPTNRAILLSSFTTPATLTTTPTLPSVPANTGTVLLRVLSTPIVPYASAIHAGHLTGLNLPPRLPLIPNANGIARVVTPPPDAFYLKKDQLVYIDCTIRARDDTLQPPMPINIVGHFAGTPGDAAVESFVNERSPWKDGTLQDHIVLPLENVYPLDEDRLIKELGYTIASLNSLTYYTVAAGAIIEAGGVKTGETVVIGPVGGSFGGAAVELALALGAGRVVVLGRHEQKLKEMRERLGGDRVEYVVMSGDSDADAQEIIKKTPGGKGADVYNDWTPGALEAAPYLDAGVKSLVKRGRVILSGGPRGNLVIPYAVAVLRDLKIVGKSMFSRETANYVIKLVEQGILDVGRKGKGADVDVKEFGLEELQDALKDAEGGGWRKYTVVSPNAN